MTSQDLKLYEDLCSDDTRRLSTATRLLTRRVKAIASRFVLGNSGFRSDIDDLVQDTVLAVWQQMRSGAYQVRLDKPLDAYLKVIVRNKWLKTLQRQSVAPLTDLTESVAEELPMEHQRLPELEEAFDRLGQACQLLLRLFYWEGYSMEEIARRLGISMKATKVRKYRCMLQLGKILNTSGPSE